LSPCILVESRTRKGSCLSGGKACVSTSNAFEFSVNGSDILTEKGLSPCSGLFLRSGWPKTSGSIGGGARPPRRQAKSKIVEDGCVRGCGQSTIGSLMVLEASSSRDEYQAGKQAKEEQRVSIVSINEEDGERE
jgi:hypothetical protein